MKSLFSIIENDLSEQILLGAEKLLDENPKIKPKEVSKNLWVFHFDENGSNTETEILLRNSGRPSYTCDCKDFTKNSICRHIAAGLLKLRTQKTKKRAKPAHIKPKSSYLTNYNFKSILEQAEESDLKNFIQSYARKNKDFSLAFKVHFASKTESDSEEQKYKKLLDEAVKPKTYKNPNLSHRNWSNFKYLLEDFLLQIQDKISEEQYSVSFTIIEKCIDKIAYVSKVFEKAGDKDLILFREKFLEEFDLLLKKNIAPDLVKKISATLLENTSYSYYHPEPNNILFVLNHYYPMDQDQKRVVIENLKSKIENQNGTSNFKLPMILILSYNDQTLVQEVLDSFSKMEIIRALEKMQLYDKDDIIEKYINLPALKKFDNPEKTIMQFHLLIKKKKYKKCFDLIKKGTERSIDFKIVNAFKKFIDKPEMDTYKKQAIASISHFSDRIQADFLSHYKYFEDLIGLINDDKNLSLLMDYDFLILQEGYKSQIVKSYQDILQHYLEEHIGTPSHKKLTQVYMHLNRISEPEIKQKIQRFIKEKFPQRSSLNYLVI